MAFIAIAYMVTVPFLLIFNWQGKETFRQYSKALLAVSNLLLLLYSIFLVRQIAALIQFAKKMMGDREIHYEVNFYIIRLSMTLLLCPFFLFKKWRTNYWLTITMLALLYWNNPPVTWNLYGLFFKILNYLCLLCASYALLWLLKQLPYQLTHLKSSKAAIK